ncbi:reverse transcriptase domain-containing protein [Cohnella silvisoli]|uniref:Reverse transcriptase domain-containing protein n=1 Tax=Cohnella silvisoli TaxID=2873699 RepID=A0ABV1KUZ6_9BACL|nr:reverse transcriptase domain-containing protein [Cohnella silvisoli]
MKRTLKTAPTASDRSETSTTRLIISDIRRAVKKGVYWVVDIDIRGYFDNIAHDKLMQLVEQRISDSRVLKLVCKWLKAGFVKDDQFHETELGSPQGGLCKALHKPPYV